MSGGPSRHSSGDTAAATGSSGELREAQSPSMWTQITRMPLEQLESTNNFVYIEKVMSLISKYDFSIADEHLSEPVYTVLLGHLLKLVSTKCSERVLFLSTELARVRDEKRTSEQVLNEKISSQNREIVRLRTAAEASPQHGSSRPEVSAATAKDTGTMQTDDAKRLKAENDSLTVELRRITRVNEELRLSLQARESDRDTVNADNDKLQLEYKHLVARYKRLLERSTKNDDILRELRAREKGKRRDDESELERLRLKVQSLQQDNFDLVQSRDRAEELCERRESEALRDMTELRRLTKEIIEEEREKLQHLRDEYSTLKRESDSYVEELVRQHEEDLQAKEEEIVALRQQLDAASSLHDERDSKRSEELSDSSSPSAPSSSTPPSKDARRGGSHHRLTTEQRHLMRENDDLQAEVEQLEIRIEALDEENLRLSRLVKEYESGDEGLLRLRRELIDATRTVEVIQSENAQLRERLNGMEDSVSFTAALQELCRRVGVTDEEINSLRPKNAAAYSEMDTLKEEVRLLKEEASWLEKERRYWMNKVRLQPLMDTKLRFELGLSSEQLKQLDHLIDEMKAGRSVVEEEEGGGYREKYYKELEARRQDALQFNEYVKQRVDEAVKDAFGNVDAEGAASAIAALKDHIDVITNTGQGSAAATTTATAQLQEQLSSAIHRTEQAELTLKDNSERIAMLQAQLSAVAAEKEALAKERDRYREIIFSAAGFGDEEEAADRGDHGPGDDDARVGDRAGETRRWFARREWTSISSTLREQLTAKDAVIRSLETRLEELQAKVGEQQKEASALRERVESEERAQESLRDQIAALNELHEELAEKTRSLEKVNADLDEAMQRAENGSMHTVLQKVVLLRRREATLLQRLRRSLTAQEMAATAEASMRKKMERTFKSLQEALEGTSTGFVLPPSAMNFTAEEQLLSHLQSSVAHVLQGKLFREDSRYLLQLQHVYKNMEHYEELTELRAQAKASHQEVEQLRRQLDEQTVEVERLKTLEASRAASGGAGDSTALSPEYTAASTAQWESEAVSWRQRYTLCTKRLEDKEEEVRMLEGDLETARKEVVEMKDHVRNLLSRVPEPSGATAELPTKATPPEADNETEARSNRCAVSSGRRLEQDVARLKSINLGLLHHTMDLQSTVKSLEIDVESARQEVALLQSSGDAQVVSDFVSAAIREHAALRRQSELALIQTKRLKVQLAASEANYRVVANEATAYKLSAYRLYRKYVEEVTGIVDYVRCIQRASKGALSPHQAEIMDRRYRRLLSELDSAYESVKALSLRLSDEVNATGTLSLQLHVLQQPSDVERADALEAALRESRVALRASSHQITEMSEDCRHAEAKAKRLEAYASELNEEVTRLEFGSLTVSPLDDGLLKSLQHLRETVFAKAEAPPVAVRTVEAGYRSSGLTADDNDVAVREYRAAVMRQTELSRECASLRQQLCIATAESTKAGLAVTELRDELSRAEERVASLHQQLDNERRKAELRESRLSKAHDVQSEVSRRAMEHNSQCLQDLIRKKEETIAQLQEQLRGERQKFAENQLEEATRLERLHEHLYRENGAMVERLKQAVSGVGEVLSSADTAARVLSNTGAEGSVAGQLQFLTTEVIRLQGELKRARTNNIVLETQLQQQIRDAQERCVLSAPPPSQSPPEPASVMPSRGSGTQPTDTLTGILHSQNALIENLRERERSLSAELQQEKQRREDAERQAQMLRLQNAEQTGSAQRTSQLSAVVADVGAVHDLRAQLAFVEEELRQAREQLDSERGAARRLQLDAEQWKQRLDTLQTEVTLQQADGERARHLAMLNEGLQGDLNAVKEQNDKLVLAATVLKQKLMEEARRGGEASRQHVQEIALAQRMGAIQQESSANMKVLDRRIQTIQKELHERMAKEQEMRRTNEEAQRLLTQLHQQLRAREQEIARLKGLAPSDRTRMPSPTGGQAGQVGGSLSHRSSPVPFRNTEKGTQMLATVQETRTEKTVVSTNGAVVGAGGDAAPHASATAGGLMAPSAEGGPRRHSSRVEAEDRATGSASPTRSRSRGPVMDHEVVLQPQVAGIIHRETQRQQRDNLQLISSLRSSVHRLEKDLQESRDQLTGERESVRALRTQLQQLRKEREASDAQHQRELVQVMQQHQRAVSRPTSAPAARASGLGGEERGAAADSAETDVARLQRRVKELEESAYLAAAYKQELRELRGVSIVAGAETDPDVISPEAIRTHVRAVMRLETVIDDLRRQLQVDVPARVREHELRFQQLQRTLDRALEDLSSARGLPLEQVRQAYSCPPVPAGAGVRKTTAALEEELLSANNTLLDLQFARETLTLRADRAERHLQDILSVDAAYERATQRRGQSSRVEALEAVIENLQLVVEKQQKENNELQSRVADGARFAEVQEEVRHLRSREDVLQEQVQRLVKRLAGTTDVGNPSEEQTKLKRRLLSAQVAIDQYEKELDDLRTRLADDRGSSHMPSDEPGGDQRGVRPLEGAARFSSSPAGAVLPAMAPPPLPQAPFAPRQRRPSSDRGRARNTRAGSGVNAGQSSRRPGSAGTNPSLPHV